MILPMITEQKSWIKAMISRLADIIGTYHTVSPVIWRDKCLWLPEIIALWYHLFLWYHVTCLVSWCWLGTPLARGSASSCLAAANELIQVEAPHWQWAWSQSLTSTAQVGQLVMASLSQVHRQSVRSHESGPGQSGVLARHSVTGSSLSSIMAVVVEIMSLCSSLHKR